MSRFASGLFGVFLLIVGAARAEPMEDVDYVQIDPQPVHTGARVEVIEFFYYGCSACQRFEPLLSEWVKRKPADVEFRRAPALRRADWIPLTRLYFALEALDTLPRLHEEVYRAIHEQGNGLQTSAEITQWAQSQHLHPSRLAEVLMSDAVLLKVQRARDVTVEYGIRTTPSLVVDGRYLTSGAMLGDVQRLIDVLDELVEMARRRRAIGNE
ncbi:MAG: thiol:disulfide interchange protein DsbA/DsbL [Burkholderiales bacterium]